MKQRISLLLVFLGAFLLRAGAQDQVKTPSVDWTGWRIDTIAPGYIWYNYTGYYAPFHSNQTVNVILFDYTKACYGVEVVHDEEPDSLSSFAERYGAIAGINGSYFEPDVSFVRVNGKTYREVTTTPDHVGFWKHEGAFFYDSKTKKAAIDYGTNDSYLASAYETVLSGAPMLIDDYRPVGETFADAHDTIDIKTLHYEDYRRHQGVRHPRVAVGLTADNQLLLVTVDGRWQPSAGMTANELTLFIQKYFSPRYALNIDGGGSTTMWIKDRGVCGSKVVNFPTDNKRYDHFGQRKVNNVILLKRQ